MEEIAFELHVEGWIASEGIKEGKAHPGKGVVNAKAVRGLLLDDFSQS